MSFYIGVFIIPYYTTSISMDPRSERNICQIVQKKI
jgi:hypothetical protein